MEISEIEQIIQECREMASEPIFNLETGLGKEINYKRYADLLEDLLRSRLPTVNEK